MLVTDFEYANRRLSDFGCIMCHITTDAGVAKVNIGCDITSNTVKNNNSSIHSDTSSSYDNVYMPTFEIAKISCDNNDDIEMTSLESRQLVKWLNRRTDAKFRVVSDISEESNVCYYGKFNVEQIMLGSKIIGLSLTFTSNAPFGFADPNNLNFMILNNNETFEICAESDELGIVYPTLKVRCFYDGDIKILNTTTGTYTLIKNCKSDETITIDGEHKIIVSDNEDHSSTIANDFNYEYLDILIDELESKNIYEVSAPCEIALAYSPVRKVGVI